LIERPETQAMALIESILSTTAPVVGSLLPHDADAGGRTRSSASSGEVARELDAEVARLLRVRSGELAEPLLWRRPSHRREVDAVVRQLGPIRTRASLLSSWQRESRHSAQVRLAYAIAWLALARSAPAVTTRLARRRPRLTAITGAG
jgi:cytochrome oxidase assembly protein ShyY1